MSSSHSPADRSESHAARRACAAGPFAAIVDPARVLAAAERASRLDLPRRKSESWTVRNEEDDDEFDSPGFR